MRKQTFYAHTKPGTEPSSWHLLEEHLQKTAEIARRFADVFSAGTWAYQAALWHDLGKYSEDFQEYLTAADRIEGVDEQVFQSGRVTHSTRGAQHAVAKLGNEGKVLAYVIAGHHVGLPDGLGGRGALTSRIEQCPCDPLPKEAMELAERSVPLKLPISPAQDSSERGFQVGLFVHMLFSAVVDADYLDTESFMDSARADARHGAVKSLNEVQNRLTEYIKTLQQGCLQTEVNKSRRQVYECCLEAASLRPGFFRLTVPTGGGKTLSSLAFALRHALKQGMRRIIYALPFTSIIDQNADVFRQAMGADAGIVLEHHSNIDPTKETLWARLASENWDVPLVVTTNVQFFEPFFAASPSSCRRLHNIAGSVVILDEAHSLPIYYLRPCLALLRELVTNYHCSVVLCTATQPAVEYRKDFPIGLKDVHPIVPLDPVLFQPLQRTRIERRGTHKDTLKDNELLDEVREERQVLCIVNTRRHARDLFTKLGKDPHHIHLSALMCPAHRIVKLREIKKRLREKEPCVVISTQLVEAGVDVDFPVVYRAMAGIDSIVQAAGRCNREGLLPEGRVIVFEPEVPIPAGYLCHAAQAAREVLPHNGEISLSPDTIEEYFRLLYWQHSNEWDRGDIVTQLQEGYVSLNFPFRTIAREFRFIRDGMAPVIIPWDDVARRAIHELRYASVPPFGIDRILQRYVVTVPPNLREELPVEVLHGRFYVLANSSLYDEETGLQLENSSKMWDAESMIV